MGGIQITLFDYFKDMDNFTLEEAKACVKKNKEENVKEPSIRARIYEGIDKGLFERVAKGVYTVTRKDEKENDVTCMLVQGDGRDLSFLKDNSIDAIITDHPYDVKSTKGGNRNFAQYDTFRYNNDDFKEKARVLKDGHFLVEFFPEENESNFEYLYDVKKMAKNNGLNYYAKVSWKKGEFVANTGRKSKNIEDIMIFSKGTARALRVDKKKDISEPDHKHFMSGTNGMLPTVFDFEPVGKKDKIHQAEKPLELLNSIIKYVSKENETILDQFAGSFVLAESAFVSGRNSISIELADDNFDKGRKRIESVEKTESKLSFNNNTKVISLADKLANAESRTENQEVDTFNKDKGMER